jgi:hypothetical protein
VLLKIILEPLLLLFDFSEVRVEIGALNLQISVVELQEVWLT